MRFALSVDFAAASRGAVNYRWDVDTEILIAELVAPKAVPRAVPRAVPKAVPKVAAKAGPGMTGSVEIEGADGSWIVLDVRNGSIASIEVAVWPDVKIVDGLQPPPDPDDGAVTVPARPSDPAVAAVEVNTRVTAEADAEERTVHFRFGTPRPSRPVRAANHILLELDHTCQIAGIWMLNVPPFPGES